MSRLSIDQNTWLQGSPTCGPLSPHLTHITDAKSALSNPGPLKKQILQNSSLTDSGVT